jgi:hypothetical protein
MEEEMTKKAGLICLVLVAGLVLSGCGANKEKKCREKYGLTKCTKEECEEKYPIVLPPDGPDIVLGPGLSNTLVWTIGGSDATDGGTVFDQANPATFCKLRKDFIGTENLHFKYTRLGQSTPQVAQDMIVTSGDIELRFKESSSGAMDWWIKNHATGKSCTLRWGAIPTPFTDVPTEFLGFTTGKSGDVFKEVEDDQDAKKAEFKVKY